ncbi:hypothetical protein [Ensifer sesbaniae]|uniref:hypothetical protein n=1 Tax=Ensifer sesbaniae TaxID=1214071 RepID=UPI001568BA4B|nr:hypothetical protein [Ensifer sesbaniae]NRQ19049.1 hypothetical protein [Ensifer sesbaniae]
MSETLGGDASGLHLCFFNVFAGKFGSFPARLCVAVTPIDLVVKLLNPRRRQCNFQSVLWPKSAQAGWDIGDEIYVCIWAIAHVSQTLANER